MDAATARVGVADPWSVGALAICLAVAGLVALALLWSGDAPYADLVRPDQARAQQHRNWVSYVTGRSDRQPASVAYTQDERAHMADVRTVFVSAQVVAVMAGLAGIALFARAARRRRAARLVRAAALAALAGVAAIGVLGALAFDAAFLLFHQIFFPQGNFLFAPGSALLEVYPEVYFYGLTMRIAISFVALTSALALSAHWTVSRAKIAA